MEDAKEIAKKQIQINWDYAKQQNDIRCRIYLQYFVVTFTGFVSFSIASVIGNTLLIFPAIIFAVLTMAVILRLRSTTYDLEADWQYIVYELEKLK